MSMCQLCNADLTKAWNVPLLESPNFVILPSLGALVEGWVLVVPKQHFLSMATLPDSLIPEMQLLKERASEALHRIYGAVCAFEHGPADKQRRVGCGVDHAHLHILPTNLDLSAAVAPYLPPYPRWRNANLTDCRAAVKAGDDYLYLEQPIGEARIVRHPDLGSQLFRRAIAAHLGIPDEFNWRNYPQIENVNKTIQIFGEAVQTEMPALRESGYAA